MRVSLAGKGLILVAVPFIFQLSFCGCLIYCLMQAEKAAQAEFRSKTLLGHITYMSTLLLANGVACGGYVFTSGQRYLHHYVASQRRIESELEFLQPLIQGHEDEEVYFQRLQKVSNEYLKFMAGVMELKMAGRVEDAKSRLSPGATDPYWREIDIDTSQIMEIEQRRQAMNPFTISGSKHQLMNAFLIGTAGNVILTGMLILYFRRGISRRMKVMVDNALRLPRGMPLNPLLGGNDEFSTLDNVFHAMARALKEAARKERVIVDNSMDVICALDADERFQKLSKASIHMWGYEPEEVIGKTFGEFVIISDESHARLRKTKESETGTAKVETQVRCKNGKICDALWSVHWSDQEQIYICVAHDMTDSKEIERMKKDFLSMVSHDLRTPINSLSVYLSLLENGIYGQLNEKGIQTTAHVGGTISRLMNLLNDLLEIEKMESGHLELRPKAIRLKDILNGSVASVSGFAMSQKINLVADECDDVELTADQDRIVQVVVNFLSNAVKFSPVNGTVRLSAEVFHEFVRINVSDSGPGIPLAQQQQVFDRYSQLESGKAYGRSGTGLGLAICKAIIEMHQGTIGVDSEEGHGSTFWIRLPRNLVLSETEQAGTPDEVDKTVEVDVDDSDSGERLALQKDHESIEPR